ncbi:ZP domain-containing protein [Caerostris darwini]|uniref:ZP domain-containing protein n=1 Tax=Caerostris darwini TaxID=1538125 RepID=A0AAV4NLH1_9ARAC|nr:ZP domain-containing protein [Caerostris darwini]
MELSRTPYVFRLVCKTELKGRRTTWVSKRVTPPGVWATLFFGGRRLFLLIAEPDDKGTQFGWVSEKEFVSKSNGLDSPILSDECDIFFQKLYLFCRERKSPPCLNCIGTVGVLLKNVFFCFFVLLQEFHWCLATMETKVSVDCHSDPQNILVKVSTNIPFEGLVYVSERYGDLDCTAFGKKNQTTFLKVPLKGCDTHQKEPGLFMSHVTVQQHPLIVSAGDGEYEVGCKLFNGDLQVGTDNRIDISKESMKEEKGMTSPSPDPHVQLRIYDFENDVFVDTVRLGQVVELEITIRDGKMYQGSVSDCDAINFNGTRYPVVRNL